MAARAGWLLLAVSGSLTLGALWFQFGMGLAPCQLCYWQRYAHLAVMALALPAALSGNRLLAAMAVAAMLASAGIAGFHAGVEQLWWPSPFGCTAALPTDLSAGAMFDEMLGRPLVRCDAIPWSLAGISMAGWNAAISLLAAMAAGWLWARKPA